jgi:hypothetical protein
MKANGFVAALLLFCVGCTSQPSDQLTQQQKDQIKHEVKAVCDTVWAKMERLDVKGCMQYFWDSPEFVAFFPDGSRMDFQAFKKMNLDFPDSASAVKLAPVREDLFVLAKDVVVYAWHGKSELHFKSGAKMMFDPDAETFVFKKIAGEWKIVYVQESATITTQKPVKK